MAEDVFPPFSVRNRGAHAQIDNDCPETTRIGLLHLLHRLVGQEYVAGWDAILTELQRIGRLKPQDFIKDKAVWADTLLSGLEWDKAFDFCERLYSHLAQETGYHNETDRWVVSTPRSEVQEYIAKELQNIFLEEHLAFEFSGGKVRRRGRRNTVDQISRAELVLGDPRLSRALMHFNKALRYFRNVSQPDYENSVKEAVCAVEAAGRALFQSGGSTLGDVVKSITGSESGQVPKTIAKTFDGLYGYRNSGEGVGHGGSSGGRVTKELAEYSLALASSQIVLLVDLASEPEIPF